MTLVDSYIVRRVHVMFSPDPFTILRLVCGRTIAKQWFANNQQTFRFIFTGCAVVPRGDTGKVT